MSDDTVDDLAVLAELAATPPPPDLRAEMMAAARARRAVGAVPGGPAPCTALESYERTTADLRAVLEQLTDEEWDRTARLPYGRVQEIVGHLVGVEELTLGWLGASSGAPDAVLDHVEATRSSMAAWHDRPPTELLDRWTRLAGAVAAAARSLPTDHPVLVHDLPTDVHGTLVLRSFEVWAHAEDVALATGRTPPRLDPARACLLSRSLVEVLPLAVALTTVDHRPPDATVRLVLTGIAPGTYDIALGDGGPTTATIVADVEHLCRVASRRLDAAALDRVVEGDDALADLVVAATGAFARG